MFDTGCPNRFTHANRHCPAHPSHGVKRDRSASSNIPAPSNQDNDDNENNARILNQGSSNAEALPATGKKRRLSRSSTQKSTTGRLRTRKLLEELDAVDDRIDTQKENDGQDVPRQGSNYSSVPVSVLQETRMNSNVSVFTSENEDVVWKKKKAALELQKRKEQRQFLPESVQAPEVIQVIDIPTQEVVISTTSFMTESPTLPRDKLLGVLALMELSGNSVSSDTTHDLLL